MSIFFLDCSYFCTFLARNPPQKGGRKILFQWESAKECVTTHLPNQPALKMDGAQASCLYRTVRANAKLERVGGRGGREEASGVSLGQTASSADLGGSSKYSNENFEGRRGEGFHMNSSWMWVSRS